MKVSVTRPSALHNPLAPPQPMTVDTERLPQRSAREVCRLADAARSEGPAPLPARPELGVEVVIEEAGRVTRLQVAEGRLPPACAHLIDTVSRLQDRETNRDF